MAEENCLLVKDFRVVLNAVISISADDSPCILITINDRTFKHTFTGIVHLYQTLTVVFEVCYYWQAIF